jgi:hypothetical protein
MKQPHELNYDDHEEGLNRGLASLLRMVDGCGKVVPVGEERDDAMALLHTIRVSLADPRTVTALVGVRHGLLIRQRAEAEAPAGEAA